MKSVFMLHVGFELSLAFRNLMGFAKLDVRIREGVRFKLHELRMEEFTSGIIKVNDFAPFTETERALMDIAADPPDVLCVSCYIWNAPPVLAFCQRVRALCPGTLVVAGGPEVGYKPTEILTRWTAIDVVVTGEGEETFRDILLAELDDRRDALVGMAGTTTRGADGVITAGPPRAPLADINVIPPPFDEELAAGSDALGHFDGSVIYETLRGCVYKCAFCLYGKGLFSYRTYDEDRVVRELGALLTAGYTVQVVDPIFGLHQKRTKRVLRRIAELDYPGGLIIESYAELIDREMAELFKAAKVQQIGVGLQSIGHSAIEEMDRRFRMQRFVENLGHLGELGLNYYVDVIYGLPEDDYEGFKKTLDFALGFPQADVEIYRLLALPGTRYHDAAEKYGLRYSPEPPYETYGCDTFPYEDVVRAHKVAQTYKLLRRSLKQVYMLEPAWRKGYSGSAAAFLEDLAGYLEETGVLDFFSNADIDAVAFAFRAKLQEFLILRGLTGTQRDVEPPPEGPRGMRPSLMD